MKKIFGILVVLCISFFSIVNSAQAYISSAYDLGTTLGKLHELQNKNCLELVNKSELIGYRLDSFNMATTQYQAQVMAVSDTLLKLQTRLELIDNSVDFSDTEKNMQRNQIYQEANSALSNLNSQTMWYLIGLRDVMPTITFQRYLSKFQDYYNELNVTGSEIKIKK